MLVERLQQQVRVNRGRMGWISTEVCDLVLLLLTCAVTGEPKKSRSLPAIAGMLL